MEQGLIINLNLTLGTTKRPVPESGSMKVCNLKGQKIQKVQDHYKMYKVKETLNLIAVATMLQ